MQDRKFIAGRTAELPKLSATMKSSRRTQTQKDKFHRQLGLLRSILPSHQSSGGWSSLISDTTSYIQELRKQIQDLSSDIEAASTTFLSTPAGSRQPTHADTPPIGEGKTVESRGGYQVEVLDKVDGLEIHMSCVKRQGLLIAIMEALEGFGLVFMKVNIQCQGQLLLYAFGGKSSEGQVIDAEMVRSVLIDTIIKAGDGV
eukprot:c22279_g1_i1 orf=417-1019(-)